MSRAIVLDDDVLAANTAAAVLRRAGFETTVVTDAGGALEEIARVCPAVVVLDRHIGKADGLDLAAAIRAIAGLDALRIVLLSGAPVDDEPAERLACVDQALLKPVGARQLIDAVRI